MTQDEWMGLFSDNLASLMHERNMTQKDLAEETGLSKGAVNKYVNGTRMPGAKAILNISYALDCDLMDLIDFDEPIE